MESNDDTYESEKEYEKNMYASGNAEDYMNEVRKIFPRAVAAKDGQSLTLQFEDEE